MGKSGLFSNVEKPNWGEMFNRGPHGYLPESGSRVQRDLVGALVGAGMTGAGLSGSPLLTFLAPFAGGAATARTEGVFLDAQQARDQEAIDALLGSMADPKPAVLPGSLNPAYGAMAENGGPTISAAEAMSGTNRTRELLAKTLQAEAGGEGPMGMLAAGSVIANRAKAGGYGDGLSGVIMKPGQFSAWNGVTGYAGGEGGLDMANMTPNADAYRVTDAILSGRYKDPTGGATHYYNPSVANPEWGRKRAGGDWLQIGNHLFGAADGQKRTPGRDAAARLAQGDFSTLSGFGHQPMSKDSLATLMGIMVDPDLSDPLRTLASAMVSDGVDNRDGLSPAEQISVATSMLGMENALRGGEGFRLATPEEAALYGAEAGQFGPDGRFYPGESNPSQDAGILRQRNEATSLIASALETLQMQGYSRDEALAEIARDPIYAPQLRILGINPEDLIRAQAADDEDAGEDDRGSFWNLFGRLFTDPEPPEPKQDDPLGIR